MQDNIPLVSIGMPVYNGDKSIRHALDSLITQNFTDFELIISDNASTDETQNICLQYQHKDIRVKYSRNEHNLGAMPNFAKVLDLSRGQYFMWAACDDLWESNFISTLLNHLIADQSIVLAMAEAQYKLSSGISLPFFAEGQGFYRKAENESQLSRLLKVTKYNYGNLIYGLYRKEVLFKELDDSIVSNMNFINENPVFIHVSSKGSIIVDPKILFYKTVPLGTYIYAAREYKFSPSLSEISFSQSVSQNKTNTPSNYIKDSLKINFVKYILRQIKLFVLESINIVSYHCNAWSDIKASILNINANPLTKIIVLIFFVKSLISHCFKMIIVWKIEDLINKR